MLPSFSDVAAAACVACLVLACAHPAVADPSKQPEPPAAMSTLGGERLGRPGDQAAPGPGARRLPKGLTARSWIVADAESGAVLAARNPHWKLPPASTLKMLFADTLLPKFGKDEKHKVTREELTAVEAGSSLVGIKEDYIYTVHEMWLGVFLASGNDAVHVLSEMNGGVPKTVEEMQRRAEELRAEDTRVVSPDGFDAPGQVSSAYDLTLIARAGLQKKDFREYCATATADFPGELKGKGKKRKRESFAIQNTNRLLVGSWGVKPYKGLAGVKNGFTSKAGNTFTSVAERDGRTLLTTVMHPETGGNTVYEETAKLLDWGFESADKVKPIGELVPPKSAKQAAGNPSTGQKDKGVSASGPQTAVPVTAGTDRTSGVWSALGLTGAALLIVAAGMLLVHRKWPLPALVAGTRMRHTTVPAPVPAPAPEPEPESASESDGASDRGTGEAEREPDPNADQKDGQTLNTNAVPTSDAAPETAADAEQRQEQNPDTDPGGAPDHAHQGEDQNAVTDTDADADTAPDPDVDTDPNATPDADAGQNDDPDQGRTQASESPQDRVPDKVCKQGREERETAPEPPADTAPAGRTG